MRLQKHYLCKQFQHFQIMPYKFTLILLVFNSIFLLAQPKLEIYPDDIEFEDTFHRNKNVLFINTGDAPLRIDSLVYKKTNYYYLRFNIPWEYPVFLQPNDTAKMDCILESHVYVPAVDTSDTLLIFSNGTKPLEKLKVKIKYYDDDYGKGYINGQITDGINTIGNAMVYFLYNNNYIISSVTTNEEGHYYAQLPPGQYAIAVEKDSHYVSFYQNQYDPINADLITLQRDSTKTIDLQLDKMQYTGNSISGIISDSLSLARLKKGILVARRGTHTPNKISAAMDSKILQNRIYTAFIKPDGSYNLENILVPGYYYVQAFSDYYIPSFYNYINKPAVFWQNADSIFIGGSLSNINVLMQRDSSVGGGKINGTVIVDGDTDNLSDAMVIAKSTDYDLWYNYSFLKDNSEFKLTNLPYGHYKLFTQKIGFNNGVSTDLQISPSSKVINGVIIPIYLSSIEDKSLLPDKIMLYQSYPNPFNPVTKIRYAVPTPPSSSPLLRGKNAVGFVSLKVYDILGNEVATLVNEQKEAGYYEVEFNASSFASGVYIYRLTSGKFISTKKMILLR